MVINLSRSTRERATSRAVIGREKRHFEHYRHWHPFNLFVRFGVKSARRSRSANMDRVRCGYFGSCRSRATCLFVSLVFCFALLHQITVFARHRVHFEPLLADFASTGINISGEWSEGEA
jgi:hypothetical protein